MRRGEAYSVLVGVSVGWLLHYYGAPPITLLFVAMLLASADIIMRNKEE